MPCGARSATSGHCADDVERDIAKIRQTWYYVLIRDWERSDGVAGKYWEEVLRMKYEFWAGSYGTKEEETIARFSLDAETGQITKLYGYRGAENPSWVCLNKTKTKLYSVEELSPQGRILAFDIGERGLEPRVCIPSRGADPCHICLDEGQRCLFAANYTSGSLAVFGLDGDGLPVRETDFVQDRGSGRNPARQEGPHVHFSGVVGERIFVADLGTDLVCVYGLDRKTGRLEDTGKALALPAGAGPRHLAIHPGIPGLIYVVCELDSSVVLFRERNGEYVPEGRASTLPASFHGENTAAAIRICGDRLLVSNRGHDSIAVFSVKEDGGLILCQTMLTGGKVPRDFAFMGKYVVIANQGSDDITALRMDSGRLEPTGIRVPMRRPTCICPVLPQ